MISVEPKETMQSTCKAPIVGLLSNGYPYTQLCHVSPVERFVDLKDEITTHPGGGMPVRGLSSESVDSSNKWYKRNTYKHDFAPSLTFYPDSNNMQFYHLGAFEGQMFPLPVDNRFQFAPFSIFPQNYHYEYQYQDFQYFVVIDFEATCDKAKNPHPQEIIEFPSVLINSLTGEVEGEFKVYVRPTCNKVLSEFCKDLTGIQQIQVDTGIPLSEALLQHDRWLEGKGIKSTNFAVVTWSNWDCRVMLESECRYKKIRKPPYFDRWINLKVPFHKVFGDTRCNLKEAVEMAGLTWEGRAHCGLDDAKNTAQLLVLLMRMGFKFSITNSMICESPEHFTTKWKQPSPSPPYNHPPKLNDACVPLIQAIPCYCGVQRSKCMVRKPGPKQGSFFFGCGNWTVARGALCQYFEWASA